MWIYSVKEVYDAYNAIELSADGHIHLRTFSVVIIAFILQL